MFLPTIKEKMKIKVNEIIKMIKT
ncbi:uncharacterized protein METZ01_LOCUS264577, partial [marine metagenome]